MRLTTLHDLLASWEAERQADRDATTPGPSAVANLCRRRLAYGLTLTPETDDVDPVSAATVGSLIHAGLALLWDDDPDTLATERGVDGGGTADVIQDVDGWLVIRDTKTVKDTKFDRWERAGGPPDEVWDQTHLYAGRIVKDHDEPGPVLLVIDVIDRDSGRCATYTREFDPEAYLAAEDGLSNLSRYAHQDPDQAPADRPGRGDWYCDSCPWATRCLGPDDRPHTTDLTEDEVVDLAADYTHWSSVAADAKRRAEQARDRLRDTSGEFGGWKVTWSDRAGRHVEYDAKPYRVINVREVK